MSNQTDLDWLARNVTKKQLSAGGFIKKDAGGDNGILHITETPKSPGWYFLSEVSDRRAELQNKPSWKDAPEWAGWLCQRDDGMWFWCIEEPRVSKDGWETRHEARATYPSGDQNTENVLGDWRDTLERRPESTKQQEQDMAKQSTTQQAEKQQDNSWFERGELPPVGEVVTLNSINPNNYWAHHVGAKLTIVSHDKDTRGTGIAVYRIVDRDGFNEYHGLAAHAFRPIRTERELAIEEMVIIMAETKRANYQITAASLYDAGYRKDPK